MERQAALKDGKGCSKGWERRCNYGVIPPSTVFAGWG